MKAVLRRATWSPNEVVTAQFLVLSKEIRHKKTGEAYLSLHLADRTGEIEAKMWDNVAEVMDTFDRDDFVKVRDCCSSIRIAPNSRFTACAAWTTTRSICGLFPVLRTDPEEMFAELQAIIAGVENPHLRGAAGSSLR